MLEEREMAGAVKLVFWLLILFQDSDIMVLDFILMKIECVGTEKTSRSINISHVIKMSSS